MCWPECLLAEGKEGWGDNAGRCGTILWSASAFLVNTPVWLNSGPAHPLSLFPPSLCLWISVSPLRSMIFGAALKCTHRGSLVLWACWCVHKTKHGVEGFIPHLGKQCSLTTFSGGSSSPWQRWDQESSFPLNVSTNNLGIGKDGASLFFFP